MKTKLNSSEQQTRLRTLLAEGRVVGYPTETVWGLAASLSHPARLSALKGRDADKPLQVSCPDATTALALALPVPQLANLAQFWPGPLTIVALASARCPAALAPGGWVGLRVPDHPVALELLRVSGPLATTSLNPAGQPAARTFQEAQAYALADLLLEPDKAEVGTDENSNPGRANTVVKASTVIKLPAQPGQELEILRLGALPLSALQAALPQASFRVLDIQ